MSNLILNSTLQELLVISRERAQQHAEQLAREAVRDVQQDTASTADRVAVSEQIELPTANRHPPGLGLSYETYEEDEDVVFQGDAHYLMPAVVMRKWGNAYSQWCRLCYYRGMWATPEHKTTPKHQEQLAWWNKQRVLRGLPEWVDPE